MTSGNSLPIIQRIEGLPIIIVFAALLALFMYTAPLVFLRPFIYTTFLSTLPPLILLAIGLTFVIGAGEIDLCFPAIIGLSGFVFAVLFKEYELGWIAVVGFGSVAQAYEYDAEISRNGFGLAQVFGDFATGLMNVFDRCTR